MDKLHQLLNADPLAFAAAFGRATRGMAEARPAEACPVWMEGWVVPARAGAVLGEGAFLYQGCPWRFHFSGLALLEGERSKVHAAGTITRLYSLPEFNGTYFQYEPVPKIGARRTRKRLRNENGVLIHLTDGQSVRSFSTPGGGLHLRLATHR